MIVLSKKTSKFSLGISPNKMGKFSLNPSDFNVNLWSTLSGANLLVHVTENVFLKQKNCREVTIKRNIRWNIMHLLHYVGDGKYEH